MRPYNVREKRRTLNYRISTWNEMRVDPQNIADIIGIKLTFNLGY